MFLARNVVQTMVPPGERHMHDVMLEKHFPQQWQNIRSTLPAVYLMRNVALRVLQCHCDRVSGKCISKMKVRHQGKIRFMAKRQYLSTLARRSQLQQGGRPATMQSLRDKFMSDSSYVSVGVQTDGEPNGGGVVQLVDQQVQVDVAELTPSPYNQVGATDEGENLPLMMFSTEQLQADHAANGLLTLRLEHSTVDERVTPVKRGTRRRMTRSKRGSCSQPKTRNVGVSEEAPVTEWFQIRQNMVWQAATSAPSAWRKVGPGGDVSLLKHKVASTPLYKVRQGEFHELITREEFMDRPRGKISRDSDVHGESKHHTTDPLATQSSLSGAQKHDQS